MIQARGTDARRPRVDAGHRLEVSVAGLSCAGDAAPLARRLERLPGVREALVNPITERGVIDFDPSTGGVEEILGVLEKLGIDGGGHVVRWHAPAPGCTCDGCRERLGTRLRALPGVEAVILNPDEKSVTVECVPSKTRLDLLAEALTSPEPAACGSPTR